MSNEIDLQPFCASAEERREHIQQPFSNGAFTYATDGHILLQVPRRNDVKDGGPTLKPVLPSLNPAKPLPDVPLAIASEHVTAGEPAKNCSACEGVGTNFECADCNGEGGRPCCECGHDTDCKTCDGTGRVTRRPHVNSKLIECDECIGSGMRQKEKPPTRMIKLGAQWFNRKYIEQIEALGNVTYEVRTTDDRMPMRFHFDGGIGILMPMTPPTTKSHEEHAA